ncbi:HCLS1-binding protein 3 isoform X1 [Ahaetulla prasina]|uniref:HCLS1-binding protein 3 isoform X1 n=2 Tax=Ahaetulla prasina TaxID=499056 RepID=UPI002649047F|nr:HCLS1-binding protein 3 isoform X1 [Ahaetulla prasina]
MQQSPGPTVFVTTRPLQNGHTGIDLSVPEYQEIRGKMMSGHVEYNILVVTQLAVFKSAKHKPEDNVQFMVSKKYSDIDEFYQKLVTRYPQTSLPPLPRKVLFVGESDIRERRAAFNEIMGLISKDVALASSPELLEFLGTRSTSIIDVKSKNLPKKEEEDDETEGFDFFKEEKIPDVISQFSSFKSQEAKKETEEEDGDVDPLGVLKSKKLKKPTSSPAQEGKTKLTIFHGEVGEELFGTSEDFSSPGNKKILAVKEDVKLFEGPDLGGVVTLGDPLLLLTASEDREPLLNVSPAEDVEELLRVEDDFEKMLQVSSKPKLKPKPNAASKPAIPRKPVIPEKKLSSSPTRTGQPEEEKIQIMDEMDILKYIKENESLSSAEPSLF